jgi:hypothetical protein
MRDIRADLQERAGVIGEQIKAAQAQFDQFVERIKGEHNSRIKDLRSELEAVNMLMEIEHRRHSGAPSAPTTPPQPQNFARPVVSESIALRRAV